MYTYHDWSRARNFVQRSFRSSPGEGAGGQRGQAALARRRPWPQPTESELTRTSLGRVLVDAVEGLMITAQVRVAFGL